MKRQHNHLKVRIIYVLVLIFLVQTACIYKHIPIVVVREKVLRFGPVPIPLNEEIKKELKNYIRTGGDTRNSGPVAFFLTNETFYSGLLDLLSRKDKKEYIKLPTKDFKHPLFMTLSMPPGKRQMRGVLVPLPCQTGIYFGFFTGMKTITSLD
jgi:hypothetical protein